MKYLNTTSLISTAFTAILFVGQPAIAGELFDEGEVDLITEHPHQVNSDQSTAKPRVNYSMKIDTDEVVTGQALFPESEQ